MISKGNLRAVADAAEEQFRWCASVLAGLKGRNDCDYETTAQDVPGFQERLLKAIQSVERAYREIKQEERRLIDRKASYRPAWFARRMKTLSGYRSFLMEVLAIGRALGDGYAWFFYERDRDLIAEHFKHQRQPLLPPGTGGLGEMHGLLKLQGFDHKALIYHGTTTFLRMGDVSFIDLKTMRVASIGEIKTKHHGGGRYTMNLALISHDRGNLPNVANFPQTESGEASLDPATAERQRRQARQIGEALTRANALTSDKPSGPGVYGAFYYDALTEVVSKCGFDRFECARVSPGLLIAALRLKKGSLGDELTGRVSSRWARAADDLIVRAKEIIDETLPGNCLHIGHIGGRRQNLILRPESIPLLWWDLPHKVLEEILFGRVMVWTLYNPAYLWQKLQSRGFEMVFEDGKSENPQATREIDGRRMTLGNLEGYRDLLQRNLMSEESVLEMIDASIAFMEAAGFVSDTKIDVRTRFARYDGTAA